jgi:hypothetical protein
MCGRSLHVEAQQQAALTTFPLVRPGSKLNTARAHFAKRSMVGRAEGDVILSSRVTRPITVAEKRALGHDEGVHHQTALHVRQARTERAPIEYAEGAGPQSRLTEMPYPCGP